MTMIIVLCVCVNAQTSNVIVRINQTQENIQEARQLIQSSGGKIRVIFTSGKILAYLPEQRMILENASSPDLWVKE
ncbi:MAG: hypothetical protein HOL10_07360 [Candidatus Marinimicrobia bacterium]|nr:hypothetical protein [Candidatus Neomarinimicrobiota bacterium]MBT5364062.1 hypothetical protein [Candidatus Neomarinimicrobiota bacterium]MBT6862931.1 hypothetical protein [Candidatus Neomarinimicrobiota bacterium]MBT7279071.1 hypothetical protein [Candidatus Neomarinimicrobiota bacterium]